MGGIQKLPRILCFAIGFTLTALVFGNSVAEAQKVSFNPGASNAIPHRLALSCSNTRDGFREVRRSLGPRNLHDTFSIMITHRGKLTAQITQAGGAAFVGPTVRIELWDANGRLRKRSKGKKRPRLTKEQLKPGTYYLRVSAVNGKATLYDLTVDGEVLDCAPPPPPPPSPRRLPLPRRTEISPTTIGLGQQFVIKSWQRDFRKAEVVWVRLTGVRRCDPVGDWLAGIHVVGIRQNQYDYSSELVVPMLNEVEYRSALGLVGSRFREPLPTTCEFSVRVVLTKDESMIENAGNLTVVVP